MYPDSLVHADQYELTVGGRCCDTFGREREIDNLKGGTIFCNSMSTYIHLHHQISLRSTDTLVGKHAFEQLATSFGLSLNKFRGNNQIFNSKACLHAFSQKHRTIDFCGVGAHHQNGVVERAIKTVVSWASTLLIDAAIYWPDEVDLDLLLMAMSHAVWLWNNFPKRGVCYPLLNSLLVFAPPMRTLNAYMFGVVQLMCWNQSFRLQGVKFQNGMNVHV